MKNISQAQREAVLDALRHGVTPTAGQHLVQIGRGDEILAVEKDLDKTVAGRGAFRVVMGDYGAGKTFFLQLLRSAALRKQMVTVHADLTPERRLLGGQGQGRALYAELIKSMATRAKPNDGALRGVLQKLFEAVEQKAQVKQSSLADVLNACLDEVDRDFRQVLLTYLEALQNKDSTKQQDALSWLKGEFYSVRDARKALGIGRILGDNGLFEAMQHWAKVVRLAGYTGLVVLLDELVNLYKLSNSGSRQQNLEQLRYIHDEAAKKDDIGLAVLLGATTTTVEDTRRGFYSNPSLKSRLESNPVGGADETALATTLLRLRPLTQENFFLLLERITELEQGDRAAPRLPKEGIEAFMKQAFSKLGAEYFLTPRKHLISFVQLLDKLAEAPQKDWRQELNLVVHQADTQGKQEAAVPELVDV